MLTPPTAHTQSSTVRRRDGITLAATGAIPHRVRAQILTEHRAELDARTRAGVRARIDAGLYPLPIPYGYRRIGSLVPALPADPYADHSLTGPFDPSTRRTAVARINTSRHGRAPALDWRIDQDCTDTIWFMTRCIRYGMTPAEVASQLNTQHPDTNHDHDYPPLLTLSGRPRPWTGRAVATLLTDPVLTGHSVWGRTHHGRPLPRRTWIISATVTHPPILDDATLARTVDILTGKPAIQPCTMRPAHACSARSRWRR